MHQPISHYLMLPYISSPGIRASQNKYPIGYSVPPHKPLVLPQSSPTHCDCHEGQGDEWLRGVQASLNIHWGLCRALLCLPYINASPAWVCRTDARITEVKLTQSHKLSRLWGPLRRGTCAHRGPIRLGLCSCAWPRERAKTRRTMGKDEKDGPQKQFKGLRHNLIGTLQ